MPTKLKPFLNLLLCFGAGSLASLSMAPANFWLALFIGLSALYYFLTRSSSGLSAFLKGWLFGFGYFLFSLSWIGNALLVEGNPYVWAWPLAMIGLPFGLAFFNAFACLLVWRFTELRHISGFAAFTASLAVFEWLRGHIFTGFPWNLYGYSWADFLPLIQIVSIGTVYWLTWLTIFWASIIGFLFVCKGPLREIIILIAVGVLSFSACYFFGAWRLNSYTPVYHEDLRIKIVQPNIPQNEKWDHSQMTENFFKQIRLSYPEDDSKAATYIIWPETALSFWYTQDQTSMNILSQALRSYKGPTYLFTGLLKKDPETQAHSNALAIINQNGSVTDSYDKSHLVPFGEYIPFKQFIPLKPVVEFSGFIKGKGATTLKMPEGLALSPLICYEVIFPGAVVDDKGTDPDFLVNVTNDAWYGNSAGPYQHFAQSMFRAVEEGKPLIRSANTGISALIGPLGHIHYQSSLFAEDTKTLFLPKKIAVFKKTVYLDGIALLSVGMLIIAFAYRCARTND